MSTLVELDDHARAEYDVFVEAADAIGEAKARYEKARQALIAYLVLHDADVGELDGTPVVKLVRVERSLLDLDALKTAEPFTYRKYQRLSTVEQLRRIGRHT